MTLAELAQRVKGRIAGDGDLAIDKVASIDDAESNSLTFATDQTYLQAALKSNAGAILLEESLARVAERSGKSLLIVPSTRLALSEVLRAFERPVPRGAFVHPSAVIESSAQIGRGVHIGALAYVGERAVIADNVTLQTGAFVAAECSIGEGALLNQRATVLEGSRIGARVVLHTGCVIGSEGFGWAFDEGRLQKIPQVGNVVLEDDVEIGANTCIDRAQTGSTRIGRGTKIDNLCQIGHNCRIGEHSALAAQCGLAGTTIIGSFTQIGGQVGFKGHITIGSRVKIGAGSAVWGDVPDDGFVSGRPARPHKEELRREVMVRKLPKLFSRVDALEKLPKS